MPDGYTIRKLRGAIENARALREAAEGGDADSKRLLDRLGQPGSMAEIAAETAELDGGQMEYLNAFPPRLLEGVRAVVHAACMADDPPTVEVQFLPGYDFEVRLSEYANQLTIHLRGPFAAPFPRDSYQRPKRSD
jgi:hypothetical protein